MKPIYTLATLPIALAMMPQAHAREIDEIIVTAQKKEENLQKVPLSVTVSDAARLESTGVRKGDDLALTTPGLTLTRAASGAIVLVRGVGALTSQGGQDSSVPIFIDGVYQISTKSSLFSFSNVQRIEVLKGPQGTLFGRNATGGVINVVTRDPSFTPAAEVEVGYGNYSTITGSFYGNAPLGSKVALNMAAYYSKQMDGWGRDVTTGAEVNKQREFAVRGKLLMEPSDLTRIVLSGSYSRERGTIGVSYRPVPTSSVINGQQGWSGGFYDYTGSIEPLSRNEVALVSGRIDQEIGGVKLTSITAWQKMTRGDRADLDLTSASVLEIDFKDKGTAFTQELQLTPSSTGPVQWLLGAFYMRSKEGYKPFNYIGSLFAPFERLVDESNIQTTTSYALFGQGTVSILPTTRLTLGARYTIDKRSVTQRMVGVFADGTVVPIANVVDNHKTFKKPTWRIGIDQDLAERTMAYLTYSRGFKSGIFNLGAPADQPARPEVLDAVELGLKSELFDRRVRFNPSIFYYWYKDIQAPDIIQGIQYLRNAARAEIYGLDVDLEVAASDALTLRGGLSYLHARYKKFERAPVTFPNPLPPFGNVSVNCVTDPQGCDVSGNIIPRSPSWTANAAFDYKVPVSFGEITFSANYAYNDGWKWAADNRAEQKPFHLVNGTIKWTDKDDRYSVRLWARNLFSAKYYAAVDAPLSDEGTPAPPRTYGVTVGAKF